MGSFAKIAAPALRLGWLQFSAAATPLFKRIYGCGQLDSSGGLNPVVAGIIERFIDSGAQAAHVRGAGVRYRCPAALSLGGHPCLASPRPAVQLLAVRQELTQRAAVLGDALRASLPPSASFSQPTGGYFVWIRLPPGLTGGALLDAAMARHRIKFHPGPRFGTGLDAFIRLSFSYYSAPDLRAGAERLGQAMRAALQVRAPGHAGGAARQWTSVCA